MAKKLSFPSRPCPKCGKPIHIKSKRHEVCGWSAAATVGVGTVTPKASPTANRNGETTGGYFRRVFKENPTWLKGRSNDLVLNRWLVDHPGHKAVPDNIRAHLSNVKSTLRSKKRKKVARRAEAAQPTTPAAPAAPVARKPLSSSKLDALELQIDECLITARQMGRDDLHDVIGLLRKARNGVVWMGGQ